MTWNHKKTPCLLKFQPKILSDTKKYAIFAPQINARILLVMKKDTHPSNYRLVVFKDFSADEAFLSKSCANTKDTIVWEDGKEYPLVKLEISSKSHPFFTGKMKFVDTAGRIDKFNKKFSNTKFSK